MRHPARARYAVIPPYPAAWLLRALQVVGEGPGSVREQVRHLRAVGAPVFASQLEGAFLQLREAAADHQAQDAVGEGARVAEWEARRRGSVRSRARAARRLTRSSW